MAATVQSHRPGIWTQINKPHKHGNHRSKGAVEAGKGKGRVSVKVLTKKQKQLVKRCDRLQQTKLRREQKRDEVLWQKRSLGTQNSPPFLVAIIAVSRNADAQAALDTLKRCDEAAVITCSEDSHCFHISVPRYKQRFCFFVPQPGDLFAILDAAKVADSLLLVYSIEDGIDATGQSLLSALFAQGLPSTVHAVQGVGDFVPKRRTDALKSLQKIVDKRFFKEKVVPMDATHEALLVLRQLGNQKRRQVTYRDERPHLLAEHTEFVANEDDGSEGTLKVWGYLRGRSLDVNGLVHITGWGDFQLCQIDAPKDPHKLNESRRQKEETVDETTIRTLAQCDPHAQTSLQVENEVDPMDAEQTWPTEEELQAAKQQRKVVKRVPKGTSEYQAAWLRDGDDEYDDDDMAKDLQPIEEEDESGSEKSDDAEEYETITISEFGDESRYDDRVDKQDEEKALAKFRAARMDAMFPDEVDTPMDVAARIRFQRYRGLKSFRTSPWDPKENLPSDYSRIFQFQNYTRARKRIMSEERDGVEAGIYVVLHVANVPRHLVESRCATRPLVLYGLLPLEHKMSVLNMAIKRVVRQEEEEEEEQHEDEEFEPIKSKDRFIFHVGFRRFCACPVFSQNTNGKKHKYERYLHTDLASAVATVYAPIIFSPASVLVFREQRDGKHELVATGAVLNVDPDRLVIKRVVLSGHPFKINRRSVVVRYLFFRREDIEWFKPVELRTKRGRHGHIRCSLGTHGHMKCVFDGQLSSEDVVLMNLYKRVYPKWNYDPYVAAPPSPYAPGNLEEEEDFVD